MDSARIDSSDTTLLARAANWLNVRLQHDMPSDTLATDHGRITHLADHFTEFTVALMQDEELVQHISSRTEAALSLALAGLKPPLAPLDGSGSAWHMLQQHLAAYDSPPEPAHIFGLVLAYGCGWSRTPTREADTWQGRWTYALIALTDLVAGAWRYTLRQLEDTLPTGTFSSEIFSKTEITSSAAGIMLELLYAQGARAEHRLSAWNPRQSSLVHFVYDAVAGCRYRPMKSDDNAAQKNPSFPRLQGGAFRNSMSFERLQEDMGITVGRVEFQVCPHCHSNLIERAVAHKQRIILSDVTSLLEGNQHCPVCHKKVPPTTIPYRIARNNWIFVPYDKGGHYIQVARWRCAGCGTLYPADLGVREQMIALETTMKELYHTKTREHVFERLLHLPEIRSLCQQQHTPSALLEALRQRLTELRAYEKQSTRCPLCNADRPQRPSAIWCRTSGVQLDNHA